MLWLRSLVPVMREQGARPPGDFSDPDSDEDQANVVCEDLQFAYAQRPNSLVIQNVTIDVCISAPSLEYH